MKQESLPYSQPDLFGKYASNCLKGIAIVMLLCHHCFRTSALYSSYDITFLIPERYIVYVAGFCKVCVGMFAFISAYGLTRKMMALPTRPSRALSDSTWNLISSRLVRLLGAFIFVFLLTDLFALFLGPGRLVSKYGALSWKSIQYWLLDMFGLAELLGTPTFLPTYWYYSLAIVIILLIPALYLLREKIGSPAFLALVFVINFTVTFNNDNIYRYILCIAVGVVCARDNVITRIVRLRIRPGDRANGICKCLIYVALLALLVLLRNGALKDALWPVWEAVIPVVLASFGCEFLFRIPGLHQILSFLGVHSGNIFLVHNLFRSVWFGSFTYSFRYPVLIIAVLLAVSLATSIVIEALKRLLHYPALLDFIVRRLHRETDTQDCAVSP
ncbi:MAG: acyltransferase [Clostridiales bacterium]|nr:acyltransferase [Clostridiales bacterium]